MAGKVMTVRFKRFASGGRVRQWCDLLINGPRRGAAVICRPVTKRARSGNIYFPGYFLLLCRADGRLFRAFCLLFIFVTYLEVNHE